MRGWLEAFVDGASHAVARAAGVAGGGPWLSGGRRGRLQKSVTAHNGGEARMNGRASYLARVRVSAWRRDARAARSRIRGRSQFNLRRGPRPASAPRAVADTDPKDRTSILYRAVSRLEGRIEVEPAHEIAPLAAKRRCRKAVRRAPRGNRGSARSRPARARTGTPHFAGRDDLGLPRGRRTRHSRVGRC